MGGPANATWSTNRVAGFVDQVEAEYPQIEISSVVNTNVDPAEGLSKFTTATSNSPNVDWIYAAYNLLLPPESIPSAFKDAVYIAGGLEETTIPAVAADRAAVIPDWPVAMGYIGVMQAIEVLDGGTPAALTCFPSGILTVDDLGTPIADAQVFPADYVAGG